MFGMKAFHSRTSSGRSRTHLAANVSGTGRVISGEVAVRFCDFEFTILQLGEINATFGP